MSWHRGPCQPWMNRTASAFRGILNSHAKGGLCVAVCRRTPCYPHPDLGLSTTTAGRVFVGWLHFLSRRHSPDRPSRPLLGSLISPLPLEAIGPCLSPPPAPPPPTHPRFSPRLPTPRPSTHTHTDTHTQTHTHTHTHASLTLLKWTSN